jgi:nicotinate-nucleotide adenylyltransferase
MNNLQDKISKKFKEAFDYTPLTERKEDIQRQFFKVLNGDGKNLKEGVGNLLTSLISLCDEMGWNYEELIEDTLSTIDLRLDQYKTLGRKVRVAIYGGAFNPITKGHLEVAKFVLNTSRLFDEVWLMPAFGHMYNKELESTEHRLNMCKLSIDDGRIKVFDYEISHNMSGETYRLVKKLKEDPDFKDKFDFSFIIGMDNANTFHNWVNSEHLKNLVPFVIVPRKGYNVDNNVNWYRESHHIFLAGDVYSSPIREISSTDVRNLIKEFYNDFKIDKIGKIREMIGDDVTVYILENNLYK